MATVLKEYCKSSIAMFRAQFEACSILTHGSSLGTVREQAIRDFLENHLPDLVRVVSGQIFDTSDTRSTQQDVIMTLNSVPRLPFASGIDLVYAEGVVATIEVKSNLSAVALRQAAAGIASVRSLKPDIWGSSQMTVSHKWPPTKILSGVVSYGGSSFEALQAVLREMKEEERPDFVLDLSKGILIQNHGLLVQKQGEALYAEFPDAAFGFMLFLTFLTEITGTLGSRGVNWRAYMNP